MKFSIILLGTICTFAYLCNGVSVDRVYFESETPWAEPSPRVMCDVTEEIDEIVQEVQWTRDGELVYRWSFNESVEVYGVLEDRVEIPLNDSDWNIQVTRLHMEIEGNFTCTVITNLNTTGFNSFNFFVFYFQAKVTNMHASDILCHAKADFSYAVVYPEPQVMLCEMQHSENSFKLPLNGTESSTVNENGSFKYSYKITSVQFTEYPVGSNMTCYNFVYGGTVEHVFWTPKEGPSCPAPPENLPDYSTVTPNLIPGCREGFKTTSTILYECYPDKKKNVELTCDSTGKWTPDLGSEDKWPVCSGSISVASALLILLNSLSFIM